MPDLRIFDVKVAQTVRVRLDADKFDQAFADEFNRYIFDAGMPDGEFDDMLGEHARYIAQLRACEIWDNRGEIEGYGSVREMTITAETIDTEIEIVDRKQVSMQVEAGND